MLSRTAHDVLRAQRCRGAIYSKRPSKDATEAVIVSEAVALIAGGGFLGRTRKAATETRRPRRWSPSNRQFVSRRGTLLGVHAHRRSSVSLVPLQDKKKQSRPRPIPERWLPSAHARVGTCRKARRLGEIVSWIWRNGSAASFSSHLNALRLFRLLAMDYFSGANA